MAFVGFDLGNHTCVVAIARQQGPDCIIDVVLNDESKRETPSVVQFENKLRFIGSSAVTPSTRNRANTISHVKRLLGRSFSDPQLKVDIASVPYRVTQTTDGFPLIHASYLGEDKAFTPTELVGMFLSQLKTIAEKATGAPVDECCIGVPVHFTDVQRRSVMDAARIAGLRSVQLLHETTAAALDYSTVRKDFPENSQVNVAFVDVGYDSTQVSIAAFRKGQLTILSHAFDRSLGGGDFDEVLFRHFAARINEEYGIDVEGTVRPAIMLRDEVRRTKEKMTTNPVVVLEIDSLMEEKDVRVPMKREEFEELSAELLERLRVPLVTALSDANLSVEGIQSLVLVGAGSRVPAVTKTLADFFGKQPQRIINATECVARGCAVRHKASSAAISDKDGIPE